MTTTSLRDRRMKLGLSQISLAQKVGVSLMSIQLWERGAGNPTGKNVGKLEEVLSKLEEEKKKSAGVEG